MKTSDVSLSVREMLDLIDDFPLTAQIDLVELLVRRASLRSGALDRNKGGEEEAWGRVANAFDQIRRGRGYGQRSRSHTPTGRSKRGISVDNREGTITMRVPEEVKPVMEILKKLQNSEATRLFRSLEVTVASTPRGNRDLSPSRPTDQPFVLIESLMLTILLNAPTIILRPTAYLTTPQPLQYQQNAGTPSRRSASKDRIDSKALQAVLSSWSSLGALIEAVITLHYEKILAELGDQGDVDEYQRITDQVSDAISGINYDVKRLKEGNISNGTWEDAKALYAHLINNAMRFAEALESFVDFAWKILPEDESQRIPSRTDSATCLSPFDTPLPRRSIEDVTGAREAREYMFAEQAAKRKSFGTRLRQRLAQLTELPRRTSTSSNSSDEFSENSSNPTRFSRPSDGSIDRIAANNSTRATSLDFPRRGKSVDIPRRSPSPAQYLSLGRSSLDALRPSSYNSTDSGRTSRLALPPSMLRRSISERTSGSSGGGSLLSAPRLPEIHFGKARAAEWLNEVLSDAEESRPSSELDRTPSSSPQPDSRPPSMRHHTRSLSASNPPIIPPTSPMRPTRHSRTHSSSSLPSTTKVAEWKIRLPADAGVEYVAGNRDRWSRMIGSVVDGGDEEVKEKEKEEVKEEKEVVVERKVFESLRRLGKKAAQRIPTFDSQGRRIGILDHGRFTSGTEEDTDINPKECITARGNLLHQSEINRGDVLVMEMVNHKLQTIVGTVEKLVMRLADENGQDMEFVDIFIQNHPFYISSADLLTNLVLRFYVEPPVDAGLEDVEYFAKWQRPIRIKVLAVLARWVKLRFEDFESDPELRQAFETFLAEIETEEPGFLNEIARIRRVATTSALSIRSRTKAAPFSFANKLNSSGGMCPFPVMPNQPLPEDSPLLMFEARDLAAYLTSADARAFRSLTMWDFVGKVGNGQGGERIDLFAKRANRIRNWVTIELTTLFPRKLRRRLLEKFILTAYYCRVQRNFHTTLFILFALHSPAVQKLKKTWEGVGSSTMEKLKGLERLMEVAGNMRELRRGIEEAECEVAAGGGQGGVIPFLPVVMKDATFVVEGNVDFVDGGVGVSPEQDGEMGDTPKLVNFDKYRTLSRILSRYMSSVNDYRLEVGEGAKSVEGVVGRVVEERMRWVEDGEGKGEGFWMRWGVECAGRCQGEEE